jgi:hypothetical protein
MKLSSPINWLAALAAFAFCIAAADAQAPGRRTACDGSEGCAYEWYAGIDAVE